jgi:two-component sensor histidine kinase
VIATRIMVVEDERIVALHLKQQLSKLGYDVVAIAASGENALLKIADLRPDLVLMDIHIEGQLDGIDVSAKIPPALDIPIIYVTAFSEEGTLERARATKPYGYLVKPFSERELHATIQMALERHRTHSALQAAERELAQVNERLKVKIAETIAARGELERVVDERTTALKQRDLLLREVYHRVKNNLQIVDSLLMMQARRLEDPDARRALMGLRGRIYALGLVHHQLMGSADLKTFDVVPFLHELSNNILEGSTSGGVNLTVNACPLEVGLDFGVPLGLLVTELVTNSLKHAFPQGVGNISVVLRNDSDGKLVLTVSDDGAGKSGNGSADTAKLGLGTGIVRSLVDQLEGTMTVRIDNGMTTEIRTAMPALS